jgi:hypothetical protein
VADLFRDGYLASPSVERQAIAKSEIAGLLGKSFVRSKLDSAFRTSEIVMKGGIHRLSVSPDLVGGCDWSVEYWASTMPVNIPDSSGGATLFIGAMVCGPTNSSAIDVPVWPFGAISRCVFLSSFLGANAVSVPGCQ